MDTKPTINLSDSIVNTTLWVLFLAIVLPIISTFLLFISGIASLFLSGVQTIEQLELNLNFNALITILSFFLLLPLIKNSLSIKGDANIYERLALRRISIKPLVVTLIIAVVYTIFELYLFKMGIVETPKFANELKSQLDTPIKMVFLFLTVGVFGPALEEIIFRGIAFYKLKQTSLSPISIIIITSIGFTLMHSQYNQIEIFVLIFIASCILGAIRHITGTLWYSILSHMAMNITILVLDYY